MTIDQLIQTLPEERRERVRQQILALIAEEKWRSAPEERFSEDSQPTWPPS